MPERDGYELTQVLRGIQEESGKRVPIVAITSNALAGEEEKCLNAGMDDYITKPVELRMLKGKLKKWLPAESNDDDKQ